MLLCKLKYPDFWNVSSGCLRHTAGAMQRSGNMSIENIQSPVPLPLFHILISLTANICYLANKNSHGTRSEK